MNNRQNEHLTTTHFLDISGTQLYVVPLRTAADTASKVISKKAIDTIFGNVEEIITISHVCLFLPNTRKPDLNTPCGKQEMIRMLEDRLRTWEKDHAIADVFLYLVCFRTQPKHL